MLVERLSAPIILDILTLKYELCIGASVILYLPYDYSTPYYYVQHFYVLLSTLSHTLL